MIAFDAIRRAASSFLILGSVLFARPAYAFLQIPSAEAQLCPALSRLRDSNQDASPVIRDCLTASPNLLIKPGVYTIKTPLVLDRAAIISSYGASKSYKCRSIKSKCAIFQIEFTDFIKNNKDAPIVVRHEDVEIYSLIFVGALKGKAASDEIGCPSGDFRATGGILRFYSSKFTLKNSFLFGAVCSTAVGINANNINSTIVGNVIGPNGLHSSVGSWSDGITIYDARNMRVSNNLFVDNTDVQLIFGGCVNCVISDNRFRHSQESIRGSFADLMVHAWLDSSGDFSGSEIYMNDVNCGKQRQCGFGVMIGGRPWYPTDAHGGRFFHNKIANARFGLDVDGLNGPMDIFGNSVSTSGGLYNSKCGLKIWPEINITSRSRRFLSGKVGAAEIDTSGCIVNQDW
jgi:hypothetical protein